MHDNTRFPLIRLTGDALLAKISDHAQLSREQKARICGYVTIGSDGDECVEMLEFMAAVLESRGVYVDAKRNGCKNIHHLLKVESDGTLEVNAIYAQMAELQFGDDVDVVYTNDVIDLKRTEKSSKGFSNDPEAIAA
ncbi:MAG: hypothetical protein AAGB01_06695 [Cyanobacteria bacterium P01_F01_bin.42]